MWPRHPGKKNKNKIGKCTSEGQMGAETMEGTMDTPALSEGQTNNKHCKLTQTPATAATRVGAMEHWSQSVPEHGNQMEVQMDVDKSKEGRNPTTGACHQNVGQGKGGKLPKKSKQTKNKTTCEHQGRDAGWEETAVASGGTSATREVKEPKGSKQWLHTVIPKGDNVVADIKTTEIAEADACISQIEQAMADMSLGYALMTVIHNKPDSQCDLGSGPLLKLQEYNPQDADANHLKKLHENIKMHCLQNQAIWNAMVVAVPPRHGNIPIVTLQDDDNDRLYQVLNIIATLESAKDKENYINEICHHTGGSSKSHPAHILSDEGIYSAVTPLLQMKHFHGRKIGRANTGTGFTACQLDSWCPATGGRLSTVKARLEKAPKGEGQGEMTEEAKSHALAKELRAYARKEVAGGMGAIEQKVWTFFPMVTLGPGRPKLSKSLARLNGSVLATNPKCLHQRAASDMAVKVDWIKAGLLNVQHVFSDTVSTPPIELTEVIKESRLARVMTDTGNMTEGNESSKGKHLPDHVSQEEDADNLMQAEKPTTQTAKDKGPVADKGPKKTDEGANKMDMQNIVDKIYQGTTGATLGYALLTIVDDNDLGRGPWMVCQVINTREVNLAFLKGPSKKAHKSIMSSGEYPLQAYHPAHLKYLAWQKAKSELKTCNPKDLQSWRKKHMGTWSSITWPQTPHLPTVLTPKTTDSPKSKYITAVLLTLQSNHPLQMILRDKGMLQYTHFRGTKSGTGLTIHYLATWNPALGGGGSSVESIKETSCEADPKRLQAYMDGKNLELKTFVNDTYLDPWAKAFVEHACNTNTFDYFGSTEAADKQKYDSGMAPYWHEVEKTCNEMWKLVKEPVPQDEKTVIMQHIRQKSIGLGADIS
ncbi:hypothetical protein BKA82DRAFT_948712 [Pisolithus tinctorius]|nr:hypothetical protein BKA82DRAFT_948712 [Pisolithus tinctorius]